jgi:ligand-binding sensor domain-containing protein
MNKKALASIWLLLCTVSTLFAQQHHFRNYSVNNGLPFVQVFTIFQDHQGYLWSGGYGGLSRFDGLSFKNFSPRNGLANHWVTSICEDSQNDLWVGTIKGVNRYHDGKFESFTTENGLPDNYIYAMHFDSRNNLWAATAKGLCRFDGKEFIPVSSPLNIAVFCIEEDVRTNALWLGTSQGVYTYSNGKVQHYAFSTLLEDDVTALTLDKQQKPLAGTKEGLFQLVDNRFTLMLTPADLEMPEVNALHTDKEGITWVGAQNGLFTYDGKQFSRFRVSLETNASKVISLYEDYEGSLWLGTHAGLYRFRGDGFVSYGVHDGLYGSFVFGINNDSKGNLWVCSETRGVYEMIDNQFVNYNEKNGLASNHTADCLGWPDGSVFIGTQGGLSRIQNGAITNYGKKDGLISDSVNCLLRDKKGNLWIGNGNGITRWNGQKFESFSFPKGNNTAAQTWFLMEDRNGLLWVGSYLGGLFTFDGTRFEAMHTKLGLKSDSYLTLREDKQGIIYIGSLDGVYIYDGKKITHLGESDGLNSDLVYASVIDADDHYFWIGTNQGLNRFDLNEFRATGKINVVPFGKEEGFSGVECNSSGAYRDKDGTLWFGTVNGLIRYSPKLYRTNPSHTKTSITSIRLFYADTLLQNGSTLNYNENNLSFEFIGICLTNPAKVRYKYMLTGFDKVWSPASASNVATYSNLPSGNYTLRVVSANNEGLWNPDPAEFKFTIATPFWRKSWFWLCTFVFVLVLATTIVMLRIRKIKARERYDSEMQVAISRNELKALRAQMNPHFVFNSLNSIQHFILNNKSADAGKYLNKFARLIRIILYNSEKALISVREELEGLQLYLDLEMLRFDNKFTYSIHVPEDIDTDYFEIPAMLLQPYAENAILHGLNPKETPGQLRIEISLSKDTLTCSIIDDGIGRKRSAAMRQLSQKKDHQSLGMKITQDRLELINKLHGSQLSVTITDIQTDAGLPSGTRVDIFIPVS